MTGDRARPGRPIPARAMNLCQRALEGLGRMLGGRGQLAATGPTPSLRDATPPRRVGRLSGAGPLYTVTPVRDTPGGGWVDIAGAPTYEAREADGTTGLAGRVAMGIAPGPGGSYRFKFRRVGPPCASTVICVTAVDACSAAARATTFRWQGPGGVDVTRSATMTSPGNNQAARATDCYAAPAAGTWTVTIATADRCAVTRVIPYDPSARCSESDTVVPCPTTTTLRIIPVGCQGEPLAAGVGVSLETTGTFERPSAAPLIGSFKLNTVTALADGAYQFACSLKWSGGETLPSGPVTHVQSTNLYQLTPDGGRHRTPPCGAYYRVYSSADGGATWHLYRDLVYGPFILLDTAHDPSGAAPPGFAPTPTPVVLGSGTTGPDGAVDISFNPPDWWCWNDTPAQVAAVLTPPSGWGFLTTSTTLVGGACGGTYRVSLAVDTATYVCACSCNWPVKRTLSYSDDYGTCVVTYSDARGRWLGSYTMTCPCVRASSPGCPPYGTGDPYTIASGSVPVAMEVFCQEILGHPLEWVAQKTVEGGETILCPGEDAFGCAGGGSRAFTYHASGSYVVRQSIATSVTFCQGSGAVLASGSFATPSVGSGVGVPCYAGLWDVSG